MPQASIVIVTRNRKEKAKTAVESAFAQEGDNEVIVMDDASTDGTSEYLRVLFPQVKIFRNEKQEGLIVLRSRSAQLAVAPVIVSIDDDAVFADGAVVRAALDMLTDPRIGVVAIPHENHSPDGRIQVWWPPVPDTQHCYVVSSFIGTAYALRKDVFEKLGGFQNQLFHWGEESEYSLRLLGAGYVVRLASSGLIRHYPAGAGKYTRQTNRYISRNRILTIWFNAPAIILLPLLAQFSVTGLVQCLRRPAERGSILEGMAMGLAGIWKLRKLRRPVPLATYRLWLFIRKRRIVRLDAVAGRLHALVN